MGVTEHADLAWALPSAIYKTAAQLWVDKQYPRHLFIETTSACNLRCDYCPRERRGDRMETALFESVIDEATRYGARSFSLHLFGEPLLDPHLQARVAYIKRCNPRHVVLLTTNGTHLEEHLDWLTHPQWGVDRIHWTWRTEATFPSVPRVLLRLRKWGRFLVRLLIEVTPPEELERWKRWRPVQVRSLHNYGGNIDVTAFGSTSMASQMPTRWPCYHLWFAPAVAWNGKILLCCVDPHQKETLGIFPETTVHEAWTSVRLEIIRQGHLRGEYRGICTNCDVWKNYPDHTWRWQRSRSSG